MKRDSILLLMLLSAAVLFGAVAVNARASSHREAPLITELPKVDGTDFYLFNSYEPGRAGFVTMVANYLPLQDPYGGPNYFEMDPTALYEILIDNDGDAQEEITFQFRFTNTRQNIALNVGGKSVAVPLVNVGPVAGNPGNLNVVETYTVNIVRGDRRNGVRQAITNAKTGSPVFTKPTDNIGKKSFPTMLPMPRNSSTTSIFRDAKCLAASCSLASARIPSWSIWARPSTSSISSIR